MTLVDKFGKPFAPRQRPETRELAAVSIRDRWSSYPSAGLTPSRLTNIFRQADWGYLRDQAELFEEMEEKDAHLAAILQTRKLAVLSLDWEVQPASEDARDQKVAEFVKTQMEDLALRSALLHLLDALGKGYAAAEILWDTSSGVKAAVSGIKPIHAKNITYVNTLTPRLLTEDNLSEGVEFPSFKILYHVYEARSGYAFRNGVLRVCAWMYLFKNYSLKDWAAFNEIFGMPLRLGKYEASATPADKEALRQAISSLGTDAAGIISKLTEIEFVEARGQTGGGAKVNPYEALINHCDRAMSKAVLGQTLTTDTTGGTGTYAAGKVHDNVREDLVEADAVALGETIREFLVWPLVGFNFGWDQALPKFRFIIEEEQDLLADSEVLKNLVEAGAGSRIPASYVNEHFGIPAPEDDEETLQPKPTPQPPGGPGPAPGAAPTSMRSQAGKPVLPLREGELELIPQDRQVIETHRELENLTQAALAASSEAAARMLAPIRDLLHEATTVEEFRDRLLQVYPEMRPEDLGELIYQARMLAHLQGRLGDQGG